MSELVLQNKMRVKLSDIGITNFRNNVGTGWVGKMVRITPANMMKVKPLPGDVLIRSARPLKSGLCKGSGDIIGIKSTVITLDMVGKTLGVFTSVEVKLPRGKVSPDQASFKEHISLCGGIAIIARSLDDLDQLK